VKFHEAFTTPNYFIMVTEICKQELIDYLLSLPEVFENTVSEQHFLFFQQNKDKICTLHILYFKRNLYVRVQGPLEPQDKHLHKKFFVLITVFAMIMFFTVCNYD